MTKEQHHRRLGFRANPKLGEGPEETFFKERTDEKMPNIAYHPGIKATRGRRGAPWGTVGAQTRGARFGGGCGGKETEVPVDGTG